MTRARPFRTAPLLVCLASASYFPPAGRGLGQDWSRRTARPPRARPQHAAAPSLSRRADDGHGRDATSAASTEVRSKASSRMRDLTGKVEEFQQPGQPARQRLEQVNSDNQVRTSTGGDCRRSPARRPSRAATRARTRGGRRRAGSGPGAGAAAALWHAYPARPASRGRARNRKRASPMPVRHGRPTALPAAVLRPSSTTAPSHGEAGRLRQCGGGAARVHPGPSEGPAGRERAILIGETLYARKQYPEAASAFADGYKRYPKGPKAPEELLKLGMRWAQQPETERLRRLRRAGPRLPTASPPSARPRQRKGGGSRAGRPREPQKLSARRLPRRLRTSQ